MDFRYLPQQSLPPEIVIKELKRSYDNLIKTLNQKTFFERLFDLLLTPQKEEFSHVNLSQIFKMKGDHTKTKVRITIEEITK